MSSFLYIRSVYSLLSSMCTIDGSIKKAKELGYKSIGLVDKNTLSGSIGFYRACLKENIKPIIGLEIDINIDERLYPVILYAKNDNGLVNLFKLSSLICTSDNKFITINQLNEYKNDNFLVLCSDNMPLSIAFDKNDDINKAINYQNELFGDDYLVALIDHDIAINYNRDKKLKIILKENNIKTIALSRTYYLNKDDYKEYEILKCIRDKQTLDLNAYYEENRYFLSQINLDELYEETDLKNSDILANNCNVNF